ncbi:RNA polymerase subunit sigma-70 [Streptomyces sp. NPDC059788]|uniref:RNA polymerase subunit sigma-70 n=1 Tax=Streptomyces sp. NPDC059788 TaxID=3346948 RepID=UPI0036496F5D
MGDGGAACGEDAAAFSRLVGRYRAELHVHCYRMLGSFEESGELVTEALLRAWRERESFAGHATFRTWLYRVATRACLDFLASRPRGPLPEEARGGGPVPAGALPWLQPCPDTLLDQVVAQEPGAGEVVAEETIALAFVVALQLLTPRQRAVFVLRDVLGWSARETAAALEVSVAAVNSALQRARPAVRGRVPGRAGASEAGGDVVLRRYVEAVERGSDRRCVAAWMNRQPAVALYARRPGERVHRAYGLEVLRVDGDRVAEVTFFAPGVFAVVGLPPTW